jgi:hypothetical protein
MQQFLSIFPFVLFLFSRPAFRNRVIMVDGPKAESGGSRLEGTRGFSALFMASFHNGDARVVDGTFLKLRIITEDQAKWIDMPNVKIFLYEVVGHFSPPLPEDTFARLDDSFASVTTSTHMESEEAVVGLRLVHTGTVPISTLIANRCSPLGHGMRMAEEGAAADAMLSHHGKSTFCAMEPYQGDQKHRQINGSQVAATIYRTSSQHGEVSAETLDIRLTSEANRVLRQDSR